MATLHLGRKGKGLTKEKKDRGKGEVDDEKKKEEKKTQKRLKRKTKEK